MASSLRKRMRAWYWIRRRRVTGKVNDDDTCDVRNMIDDLPESLLLVEIISRLHNPRDVIVCKSVSKRWNSLISSPSFNHNPTSLALILNTHPHSSYRDVLLCKKFSYSRGRKTNHLRKRTQLYIVNPLTMQWTRLPETDDGMSGSWPIGLSGNGSKGGRFYVVELSSCTPSKLCLYVLDSKRGKWRERSIEHQPWSQLGWYPTQCQALSFNGALHWLAHDGPIVAYSPNYRHECIIIHRLQEMRHASYGDDAVVSETLTVSMGHLRIIQLVCYPITSDGHHHLSIWTLVDYRQSIWKQEHEATYFSDMVSDVQWIQDYMQGYNLSTATRHGMYYVMKRFMNRLPPPAGTSTQRTIHPKPLHCHPNNPLLIYLCLPESIVLLDLATKKLRLITSIRYKVALYEKVIPMTLHLDPSLIPDHERVLLPPSLMIGASSL
ncbi:unnamed protein product [Thlaspi arvense]|uniref:F-box domain-containing protein n=1 Tax=Thlaspi arvense TaxID=13288 RepID=A0AAU9SH57_THLAR|nr:unnamed protein product [Thlaspi arvense]